MIGLEFLINIYGLKNKDIANTLGISPVTVHDWIKGKRKIPLARIEELSNIFENIPKEYFQKELTKEDELKIQRIKLDNEWEVIIKASKEKHILNEEEMNKSQELFDLNIQIMNDETKQRFKKLLEIKEDDDKFFNDERYRFLNLVGDIIQSKDLDELLMSMELLNLLLHYYNPDEEKYSIDDSGELPENSPKNKYLDEYYKLLSKNQLEIFEKIKEHFEIQDKYSKIIEEQNILPWETDENEDNNQEQ